MSDKKFYLGLDIGTSSVGFAVTDDQYNLIRKKGKHLWGSRLFDEAKTAEGRRQNRSNRRRLARRRERIVLLRDMFVAEISKIDPNFFRRLDYSSIHKADKPDFGLSLLEGKMSDKQFYKAYPTIYHLRNNLLIKNEKADIREIYLVLAHMIKYRGNFLLEGELSSLANNCNSIIDVFCKVNESLKNIQEAEDEENFFIEINKEKAELLCELFKESKSKDEFIDEEKKILECNNKTLIDLLKLINGSSAKFKKIFKKYSEDLEDEIKDKTISFETENFEEDLMTLNLDDSYVDLLLNLKSIYDMKSLRSLLKDNPFLSGAMVKIYEDHKNDLKTLKEAYQQFASDKYESMFLDKPKFMSNDNKKSNKEGCSYSQYIGRYFENGHTNTYPRMKIDELYKRIRIDLPIDILKETGIDDRIKSGEFLKIQNNKSNGVLPYQLNKNEMRIIIEKQGKYYPFLMEKAKSFLNPSLEEYKLISLLEYKIPYYVGPLKVTEKSKNAWIERKNEGKINPWNFHDLVDENKTASNFINRMKEKCSYLNDEDTLPKYSLLNLRFQIYNELNNVYIGEKKSLSLEDKEALFDNVYKKNKKITITKIKECLNSRYKELKLRPKKADDEEKLSDIFKTSYSSYVDLASEKGFGPDFDKKPELFKKAEKVIELITLFEEKTVLKNELTKLNLTDGQIRYFCLLKYKGWSRFSKKLLINESNKVNSINFDILSTPTTKGFDNTKEHRETIYNLVKNTNENFMQVLNNSEYGFIDTIEKYNNLACDTSDNLFEQIEDEYASPAIKRSIRQTLKIVQELKRILKIDKFDRVFVECTRKKEDPNRKDSRKKKLENTYNAAKALIEETCLIKKEEFNRLFDEFKKIDDDKLSERKVFYYFAQFGHDVYTGESLGDDPNKLDNYDIDHIIPRAMTKDDSFVNKVLVSKPINNLKSDTYPFGDNDRILTEKGKSWIRFLNRIHNNDYMTNEKMNRILRTTPLSNEEMEGFINRQLTTTNQSVKAVCDILKKEEKGTTIIYSKASLVSDFRNLFDLIKIRQLNNLHHANDAYLNIVVGNVYYEKFNNLNTKKYVEDLKQYNLEHPDKKIKFFTDVKSVFEYNSFIPSFKNDGTIVWQRTLPDYEVIANSLKNNNITDFQNIDSKERLFKKYFNKLNISNELGGTIEKIRKTLSWNDPMITRMLITQNGGFFQKIGIKRPLANRVEGDNSSALFPLKNSHKGTLAMLSKDGWQEKYGGYSNLTTPFFYLVESDGENNEIIYSLEAVPTIVSNAFKSNDEVEQYLKENTRLLNPRLVFDYDKNRILINTKIYLKTNSTNENNKESISLAITGRSGNGIIAINQSELFIAKKYSAYYKLITNLLGLNLDKKDRSKIKLDEYRKKESITFKNGRKIDRDQNLDFFDYLCCEKYSKPIFKDIPCGQSNKLRSETAREKFKELDIIDQTKILNTMIELLQCASVQGKDLNLLIDKAKSVGIITFSKQLKKGTRIVQPSCTGFYEKVIFKI